MFYELCELNGCACHLFLPRTRRNSSTDFQSEQNKNKQNQVIIIDFWMNKIGGIISFYFLPKTWNQKCKNMKNLKKLEKVRLISFH